MKGRTEILIHIFKYINAGNIIISFIIITNITRILKFDFNFKIQQRKSENAPFYENSHDIHKIDR